MINPDDVNKFIDNIEDEVPASDLSPSSDKPLPDNKPISTSIPADDGIAIINQPALPRNKMSPKQRLIADVIDLYPGKTKPELSKMKVSELKELITNKKLIEDTAKISHKPREELERMTTPELKREIGTVVNDNLHSMIKKEPVILPDPAHEDIRANTLYNFHRVAAGIIECVFESEAIQARTGSNLAGLSQDLRDDKEEFLVILKDLYREYHEEIDMYITPLTVYGIFMMEKVQNRYMENKKKILSGQSVKSPLKLEALLGLSSQSSSPSCP